MSLLSDGQSRFLDGAGLDEHLQTDMPTGSVSHLTDHLGSTGQLVDSANGSAKARYDYKSYGRLEGDIDNPVASNSYTYTGREDDGTGLMYYRARYYDPELEFFISEDPLGDAQRYVGGNPLGFVDPLGLDAWGDANDFIAGFGDVGSFGISKALRGSGRTFLGRIPNTCSQSYSAGGFTVTAASLATGGAGLVRGTLQGAVRSAESQIVSQTIRGFSPGKWLVHFEKHGAEFGYTNAVDYLRGAQRLTSGGKNIRTFIRTNGDTLFYNQTTNEFAALSKNGIIRTYFRPESGENYWLKMTMGR